MKNAAFCLLILLFSINNAQAQSARQVQLWQQYNADKGQLTTKLKALSDLSVYYFNEQGNLKVADTLAELAMATALQTQNRQLILKTYSAYFDLAAQKTGGQKAKRHAQEIRDLYNSSPSNVLLWYALYFESVSSFVIQDFDKSFAQATEAYALAEAFDSTAWMIKSLVKQGQCKDWMETKAEALRYYLPAADLANTRNNVADLNLVYSAMARLFYYNHNSEKAKEYRQKCVDAIKNEPVIDSLALLEAEYYVLESTLGELDSATEYIVIGKIAEAKKKGYIRVCRMYWAMLRTDLIGANKFKQLYQLYHDQYPEELEHARQTDLRLYWRINAYMQEYLGNIKEAQAQWKMVLDTLPYEKNPYLAAHINNRYAEFLYRINKDDQAKVYAKKGFDLALKAKFRQFQITSLEILESVAIRQKDFKEAHRLAELRHELKLQASATVQQDGLLLLEFQHEVERRELIQQREEAAQQSKIESAKFRGNAFLIGFVILIILSIVIFRQYTLTSLERNKSNKLLLNILPADTAEELKKTGTTTARLYENVTVLFCDIVGFTTLAEHLTPSQLVGEIDAYFRAFDDVVETFGLEKIKTVGDAYVAVAGMPLYNKASATDAVRAGLAMQQKVSVFMQERQKNHKPFFELRVGLHTGSLVAGVVGSKKFQFDIWGDTVNIAARMQENSEPGKINISETTFLRINSRFTCTSRGFIEAKHKGSIAMYFVENEIAEV